MTYLQKKKLAFMTIVNRIKGFVRSISGALPLTLTDCADSFSVANYTISGNSVQDGTPAPDAPVEVESVGDLVTDETDVNFGKYKIPVVCSGKNLFDKSKSGQAAIQTETARTYWFTTILSNSDFASMLAGAGTYAISYDIEFTEIPENYGGCDSRYGIAVMNSTGSASIMQSVWNFREVGYKARVKNKFTITDEAIASKTFGLRAYSNAYYATEDKTTSSLVFGKVIISNIQIEKSDTANDYEPYVKPVTTNIYLDEPLGEGNSINYVKDGLPKLPTVTGTTVYTVDTAVQPSNMSVTYYATSKE